MRVNHYAGRCTYCDGHVKAKAGYLLDKNGAGYWEVAHVACHEAGDSEVIEFYSPVTGNRWTQNRNGLCEDAPCCGCCTF